MRTSIELTDEQRAALMSLAARRGMRGYSLLVQEALTEYLGQPAPAVESRKPKVRKTGSGRKLLAFLAEGVRTGRVDGSEAHDDYIYRRRS